VRACPGLPWYCLLLLLNSLEYLSSSVKDLWFSHMKGRGVRLTVLWRLVTKFCIHAQFCYDLLSLSFRGNPICVLPKRKKEKKAEL